MHGSKIFKSKIHHILNNKFYMGLMEREGKVYQGKHIPIISPHLFEQVQDILNNHHHSKPEKHFYSARGFLTCASCGCMLTADTKKGHQYYYCTNGKGNCEAHKSYLRSKEVDALLSQIFLDLKFDDEAIEMSGEAYRQRHGAGQYNSNALQTLQNELTALDVKESLLTDVYGSQTLRRELYEAKMQEVANRRVELKAQLQKMGAPSGKPQPTFEQIREVFLDGNRAAEKYLIVNDVEKRKMLGKLLSNATVQNKNMAQYQFKSIYQPLANTPKNADFRTLCAG